MAAHHDLVELSRHLKQERLFISAEKDQIQALNSVVAKTAESLYHISWIAKQQKLNLDQLILGNREATPIACCQVTNNLEGVNFVDGYKHLSYHESKFGDFLKHLRENPKLVALCLMFGEKDSSESMQKMARIIMSAIYGSVVMHEDEQYVLQLLKLLIHLQMAISDNPRRLLRKGSCAFSVMFKLLNEGMFSAKLFLTAALYKPVMQLLMEDEWFYDVDPERALHRFPPQERERRFGKPGTEEYEHKVRRYRDVTTNKLVMLTERFITSISSNMYCFPQSLGWLVTQLYNTVIKAEKVDTAEARAMCADLVFAFFICPAICDPEPYGITSDAPISYIARHNLMQVAQILQVLAISRWEEIDPKTRDLFGKFEKECVSSLLDTLLDGAASDNPPQHQIQLQGVARSSVLITMTELLSLVNFVRNMASSFEEGSIQRKQMEDILSSLPNSAVIQSLQNTPTSTPQPTPPGTPGSTKKHGRHKERKRLLLSPLTPENGGDDSEDGSSAQSQSQEEVLVVSLGLATECPGMQPEHKVMEEQETKQRRVHSLIPGEDDPISESDLPLHEKRTRFSLSHDQDSIEPQTLVTSHTCEDPDEATSDNLEAISEAASSHSVGSDLENENDNLSDMLSANVSERGTPNISGRDTPLSQAEVENVEEPPRGPDMPVMVEKANRDDVPDRFGKFEIKAELERDEIKSTVSDTWSTDVLASDSEPPESNQLERLEEVAEEMGGRNLLGAHEVLEVSETASDAWSTDVLASDTSEKQAERLLELDQDDMGSISSRSQGQEDPDNVDEAHQGGQLANEDARQLEELGAIGGLGDGERNSPFQPVIGRGVARQLGGKHDRFSDPSHGAVLMRNLLEEREARQRAVSEIVGELSKLEINKNSFTPNPRASTSFKHAEGRVEHVLQIFDPLAPVKDETQSLDNGRAEGSDRSPGHLGPISEKPNCVSPDQGISSPGSGALSDVDSTKSGHRAERDSGLAETPQENLVADINAANDLTIGLKLTEQQNFKIDANRLSAAASMFDPLIDTSSPRSPPPDGAGRPRTASEPPQVLGHGQTLLSKLSFYGQGARPKFAFGDPASTPRISVQRINGTGPPRISQGLNLIDPIEPNRSPRSSNLLDADTQSSSGASTSSSELPAENGGSLLDGDIPSCRNSAPAGRIPAGEGSYGVPLPVDMETKSRSSTGSSTSSSSVLDISGASASASKTVSVETVTAQKGDERDSAEVEEKSHGNKKMTGFFHSLKGRLSKTAKRKIAKPFEKEERDSGKMTSLNIDGDAGGAAGDSSQHMRTSLPNDVEILQRGDESRQQAEEVAQSLQESTDDILAKYRRQPQPILPKPAEPMLTVEAPINGRDKGHMTKDEEDGPPAYDLNNLENCKAFLDAKKKLRMVLSTADFQALPGLTPFIGFGQQSTNERRDNDLVAFLQLQLAEAINLQDKHLIAQLHETIRCLRQFDNDGIKRLLRTMKDEYKSRSPYIAYLVRCRQGLLTTKAHLDRILHRIQRDKDVCNKYFVAVLVRLFLEKRERSLMRFIAEFQKLTVSDEKTDLVEQFLEYLHKQMEQDPLWQSASDKQLEDARVFIERTVMSHVYTHAMYPNGDGDLLRDQILHEHMEKLARVITPNHKDLRIPKMYHYECPWPAAQAEIYMINAYKTPKDKLACVLRCSSTIMNLLRMANEKSVPAADDFMPVLIYVLIKANPPSLLSTVQYVNSFYEKRLEGEEQYWWMQFSSGIEFVKTMDYGE